MNIKGMTRAELPLYVERQLQNIIPDGVEVASRLAPFMDKALARLHRCINAVKWWKEDEFNYLHSTQYCIFLYFLANTIWRESADSEVCTRLFLLNKALNGIDCFYEIELPDIFFIGHSVGVVLAKATYSDYLVLYQNSTVGKNHGVAPVLERGVIMYPNTAIIGDSLVRENSVISQGSSVINKSTPGNCYVFDNGSDLSFVDLKRDILSDIFRL